MQVIQPLHHGDRTAGLEKLTIHFENALLGLLPQGIAVGLSGGPDSWALALAAHDYARQHQIPFVALTVDHGLRAESVAEVQSVAAECIKRGIPHDILTWQHDGIDSRKQERARIARYQLLGDYCAVHGFTHLLTAHHADDQAETVLQRFAKASGSAGLAGMAISRPLNDKVTLLRPFLNMIKADLIAAAQAAGVSFVTDPSNADPAYGRARLRAARSVLEAEGLTTQTLLKTAAVAAEENAALHFATQRLLLDYLDRHIDHKLSLPLASWQAAPLALQMRAWQAIRHELLPAETYPPDRDSLRDLCISLNQVTVKRTLGGIISASQGDSLHFWPENRTA